MTVKIILKKAPLSTLVAIAKQYARDIDNGADLRIDLEQVMKLIPDAKEASFQ